MNFKVLSITFRKLGLDINEVREESTELDRHLVVLELNLKPEFPVRIPDIGVDAKRNELLVAGKVQLLFFILTEMPLLASTPFSECESDSQFGSLRVVQSPPKCISR